MTSLQETTWIGLQVGIPQYVPIRNQQGEVLRYENVTGCYWPDGVRPRLAEDDPCPGNAVDKCSVPYTDTFHGQWEDGKLYDDAESAAFWGTDQPSNFEKRDCFRKKIKVDDQSRVSLDVRIIGEVLKLRWFVTLSKCLADT